MDASQGGCDEGISGKRRHMEGPGCMAASKGCAGGSPASCVMTEAALQGINLSRWPHLTVLTHCTAPRFRGWEGEGGVKS